MTQRAAPRGPSPLATITPAQAARCAWDVAVVGAGPAGSLAARESARLGARVLLLDKTRFPRSPRSPPSKVCGCCLGAATLDVLDQVGLGDLPARHGARPLKRLELFAAGRQASITLPRAAALSRAALDTALVCGAIQAGAAFLSPAAAALVDTPPGARRLRLRGPGGEATITARVIIAADGLAGRLGPGPCRAPAGAAASRIGAGAIVDDGGSAYPDDAVSMACARGGYVGIVRLETGRLDVAAALDPPFVKRRGGPGPAASAVLARAGLPRLAGLDAAPWRGTPRLTCRREAVAAERLLVIGDAAGYVEPFTGEGIGWALASGRAVAALATAAAAAETWDPRVETEWRIALRRLLGRRQRTCRSVARLLRHPWLTALAVRATGALPALAAPLVRATAEPLGKQGRDHGSIVSLDPEAAAPRPSAAHSSRRVGGPKSPCPLPRP